MSDPNLPSTTFTEMKYGTREDYALIAQHEEPYVAELPDRLLAHMALLVDNSGGFAVSRLEHSLQSATRALRDGRDEEYVVCALLHDIGDMLAPHNHSELAATILAPFVSEENEWIVRHHGVFQGYYFFHHYDVDPNARDKYKSHPSFDACAEFCELYDQNCFDPHYDTEPLSTFEPMVRRVMKAPKRSIYSWHVAA